VRNWMVVASSWVLGSVLFAMPASADIAPDDACVQANEGKACDNAGDSADQPGTCTKDSCTRHTPDGPMTYDCYLCKAAEGGSGGSGNEAGAKPDGGSKAGGGATTGGTSSTAGTKASDSKDSGGCNVSAVPVGALPSLVAPLLAFGLAAARRRRARR
jgi:MYXO-CTERM domain-containing protein